VLMAHSGPIFVGGTGRSGTTVTAMALGSHPRIHMVPIEVRFIVDPGGALFGHTSSDQPDHGTLGGKIRRHPCGVGFPGSTVVGDS